MIIFFDNTFSPRIARSLREVSDDVEIVILREEFAVNTLDVSWIPVIANKEYKLLTGDGKSGSVLPKRKNWKSADFQQYLFIAGLCP